jgi:hypothetical protein
VAEVAAAAVQAAEVEVGSLLLPAPPHTTRRQGRRTQHRARSARSTSDSHIQRPAFGRMRQDLAGRRIGWRNRLSLAQEVPVPKLAVGAVLQLVVVAAAVLWAEAVLRQAVAAAVAAAAAAAACKDRTRRRRSRHTRRRHQTCCSRIPG